MNGGRETVIEEKKGDKSNFGKLGETRIREIKGGENEQRKGNCDNTTV